jgi:hypothetical protein
MRNLILIGQVLANCCILQAQNCPALLNCQPSTLTVCDLSNNDSLYWHDAPYTWSPVFNQSDLYEGAVDLTLKILPCAQGGPVQVSYTIYFDLNQDNLDETLVSSTDVPPPGRVLFNNALLPGGGSEDTLWFDKRPIPVPNRFQFALESGSLNDTLFASVRWMAQTNPGSYVLPRMPEGKHRIVWTVTQDGNVRFCQYNFRVRDCMAPEVFCVLPIQATLPPPDGLLPLQVGNLLDHVTDNISPFSYIDLALGAADGTAFPLDAQGAPQDTMWFDCSGVGEHLLKLWARDHTGNVSYCLTSIEIANNPFACPYDFPEIATYNYWNGDTIADITYYMRWVDEGDSVQYEYQMPLDAWGFGVLDTLPQSSSNFTIVPYRNDNPLNGVSTFDLLQISKHILGIEALNAPWKLVAADVNKNNSVTNFDILELRRLLLGIYDTLPGNTSWRFFSDACNFPPNPFTAMCPSALTLATLPIELYEPTYYFFGVKTGDVNGSATMNTAQAADTRGAQRLEMENTLLEAGEIREIPVFVTDIENCQGLQLELQYRQEALEILDVLPGALSDWSADNWYLGPEGRLRISWEAPEGSRTIGPAFFLRVRAQGRGLLSAALALATEARLQAEWYSDGAQALTLGWRSAGGFGIGQVQPNPARGAVLRWPVSTAFSGEARLCLWRSAGEGLVREQYSSVSAETAFLQMPVEGLMPGLYFWQWQLGDQVFTGKVVLAE